MSKRDKARKRYQKLSDAVNREWKLQEKADIFAAKLLKQSDEVGSPLRSPRKREKLRGKKRATSETWRENLDGLICLHGHKRDDKQPLREGYLWSSSLKCFVKVV